MASLTDPWNTNRYAFAGGNPITGIESDGHLNAENGDGGFVVGSVLERCPACVLHINDDGNWRFDGDGSGNIVETTKPLLHAELDVVGLVPVGGEVADGLNCAWYGHDGETTNAALSCASAIPFAGWASTLSKWGLRGGAKTAANSVPRMSATFGGTDTAIKNMTKWAERHPEPGYYDVIGYGSPNSLAGQSAVEIADKLRVSSGGQNIRLLSCWTACPSGSFAQDLANNLGVRVMAPHD